MSCLLLITDQNIRGVQEARCCQPHQDNTQDDCGKHLSLSPNFSLKARYCLHNLLFTILQHRWTKAEHTPGGNIQKSRCDRKHHFSRAHISNLGNLSSSQSGSPTVGFIILLKKLQELLSQWLVGTSADKRVSKFMESLMQCASLQALNNMNLRANTSVPNPQEAAAKRSSSCYRERDMHAFPEEQTQLAF